MDHNSLKVSTHEKIIDEALNNLPSWLPKLYKGKKVFGKRKDLLIASILDHGGMYLLEGTCGISFEKHSRTVGAGVSIKRLRSINKILVEEENRAASICKELATPIGEWRISVK